MIELIIWDLDDTLFDTTGQLRGSYELLNTISLFPGAREIFTLIPARHALVTKGDPDIQNRKIDILKIRNLFWKIVVCNTPLEKHIAFEQLIKELVLEPKQVVVIGNRVDEEIYFGNSIGCITVLLEQGKYKGLVPKTGQEPSHRLPELTQLPAFLKDLN
jgi:FMN phosphatase YigB (HAD superfamily)